MILRRFVAALLFCLAGSGCIEFEKQILLLRWDRESDTIRLRLLYQGIYAGATEKPHAENVGKGLEQLREVADRGTRFFLFDNWPLEVDVGKPEEGEDDGELDAFLRPFTTVQNGNFFLDGEGRLCAWQDVEFRNASELMKRLNQLISVGLLTKQIEVDADAETKQLLATALKEGHRWVRWDEKGIALEFPVSDADLAKLREEALRGLVKEIRGKLKMEDEETDGKVTEIEQVIRVLSRNAFSLIDGERRVTIRLSADSRGVVRMSWWNKGRYVPNLVEPGPGGEAPPRLPRPLDKDVSLDGLVKGFESDTPKRRDASGSDR